MIELFFSDAKLILQLYALRIENELVKIPVKLKIAKTKRAETIEQLQTAKVDVEKPFAFDESCEKRQNG